MYGYIALIGLFFQLIPFADLGLGAAVSTAIARRELTAEDSKFARETVKAAFRALVASSVVLLLALSIASALGLWPGLLGLPASVGQASGWAILVSLAPFAISLPFGLGQRMLLGEGKNHVVNIVAVIGPVLATLATLALAMVGAEPLVMAIATPLGVLAVSITCFILAFRQANWRWRTVLEAREATSTPLHIWRAAAPMMIMLVTVPLALQSGRLILAHVGTADQLATYSLAAQFYAPTVSLITTAGITLWPSFARLGTQGRPLWSKSLVIMSAVGLAAALLFFLLVRPIAWLVSGQQIEVTWNVAAGFAALILVTALHQPSAYLLTTPRLLKFQAGSSVAMVLVCIPLAVYLSAQIGAAGPVWAMAIAVGACQVVPCLLRSRRYFRGSVVHGNRTVSIYDPNDLNPYGLEVGRIISTLGAPVSYWGVDSRRFPSSTQLSIRAELAGSVKSGSLPKQVFRRITGPVRVAFSAPLSSPLVVVWTRDAWDAVVFLIRAKFGGETLFVYHNPAQVRPRTGLQGLLERGLLRHSRVCVHAPWMADLVRPIGADVVVTPHPPFSFAAEMAGAPGAVSPRARRVGIVGALRPDKGSEDLPEIARASGGGWCLVVAGPDAVAPDVADQLGILGVHVEYAAEGRAPTEEELHAAMRSCDVVVAPYRLVTESGSVLLALSLGVPVLGYESNALARVVSPRSLVTGPQQLGEKLSEFLQDRWDTYRMTPQQLALESRQGWEVALG
ncbi:hypothetical protein [Mycetocola sp. 2940]|uniref:glycosyltransferase n=1 Tax=Mycetocola sp. 2940 TaxID=3156452 RepID=UPI0033987689